MVDEKHVTAQGLAEGEGASAMNKRFEDLWQFIPTDGASTPISVAASTSDVAESQELLEAWFKERQENIENKLYLDLACQLLSRILSEGSMTRKDQRTAKHLIQSIKASRKGRRDGQA